MDAVFPGTTWRLGPVSRKALTDTILVLSPLSPLWIPTPDGPSDGILYFVLRAFERIRIQTIMEFTTETADWEVFLVASGGGRVS